MTSIEFKRTGGHPFAAGAASSLPKSRRERLRRALNVSVAVIGLILAAPLLLVIAGLVKLTSRGSVFYTQKRIGVDRRRCATEPGVTRRRLDDGGRKFTIYKFRTMREGNGDAEVWAEPDDPRVTPIGRILRKYRLDEVPQLFNVLRRDMNVVGPRPEQPSLFKKIRVHVRNYQARQQVLPGITGWAQVTQQYDSSIEDVKGKLALDMEYIGRRSAAEDFRIMVKTVPVVLFKRGAW